AYTVGKLLYLPPRAIVLLDLLSHCFSFHCCGPLCVLHSFPTRRSSDLAVVPHYLFGDRRRALHAAAPRAPGAVVRMNRSTIRKLTNILALGLSGLATAIGLFFLGAILWTLIRNGLAGVSLKLFTAMTPP